MGLFGDLLGISPEAEARIGVRRSSMNPHSWLNRGG